MKKIVRLTESDLNKIVRMVIKEESDKQNLSELLGLLVQNLWKQYGSDGYKNTQTTQTTIGNAAKNVKINNGVQPGVFLWRKKGKVKTPGASEEQQFGEILLKKDLNTVEFFYGGKYQRFMLDDMGSFDSLKNIITSDVFTNF